MPNGNKERGILGILIRHPHDLLHPHKCEWASNAQPYQLHQSSRSRRCAPQTPFIDPEFCLSSINPSSTEPILIVEPTVVEFSFDLLIYKSFVIFQILLDVHFKFDNVVQNLFDLGVQFFSQGIGAESQLFKPSCKHQQGVLACRAVIWEGKETRHTRCWCSSLSVP